MKRARDVTKSAAHYLYDSCQLEPGVIVRDIFALMGKNPIVEDIFSRYHARQLVKEALMVKTVKSSFNIIGEEGSYIKLVSVPATFGKQIILKSGTVSRLS